MGSKSNTFETNLLKHILQNVAIANIGDASGLPVSATAGNVYVRLCTSATAVDDATLGTECAYTGYAAKGVAIPRSTGGWTVSAGAASNAAAVTFGACTAGSETVRYFEVWDDNSSSTEAHRLYWGQLTADLAVSAGITPEFAIGQLAINED